MLSLLLIPFKIVGGVLHAVFGIVFGVLGAVFGILGGIVSLVWHLLAIALVVGLISAVCNRRRKHHDESTYTETFRSFYKNR